MTDADRAAPDVSIIIASWNAKQLLMDCLESLERSTGAVSLETIVVDNGSEDGSPEAVEEHFPDVTLVRNQTNQGFTRANNAGIGVARGRYICLLNSDVIVEPDTFEKLVKYMDAEPGVGMVGPRVLNGDRTLQVSCYRLPTPMRELFHALGFERAGRAFGLSKRYDMATWPKDRPRPVEMISGCCNLIRREAIDHVGLMDERLFFYGDDKDYCKRFRDAGWGVAYYPLAEIVHFGGGSSRNAPLVYVMEFQKAQLKFWEIHYGRAGRMYYTSLSLVREALRLVKGSVLYVVQPRRRAQIRYRLLRSLVSLRCLAGMGKPRDAKADVA